MNDRNLNCFSTSLFLPFLFLSPLPPHFLAKVSFLLINPNTLWYRPREERREGGREAESSSREWNMKIFGGATIACLLRRLSLYLYASRAKLCSSCVSPLFYPRFFSRRGSIDDRFDESLETLELKMELAHRARNAVNHRQRDERQLAITRAYGGKRGVQL